MTDETRNRSMTDRLKLLHQCSRDSEMGRLLRLFWQPVARSAALKPGTAKSVRVLGEELTLYRGESGKAYLVGGRCAHRLTLLHTGWVQGECIRCMYHGWQFDGSGRCIERPAEGDTKPPSNIRIPGYPVHEYAGLIFTYMGEKPAPEFQLLRKNVFEEGQDRLMFAREEQWPCNWFQQVENSLDATHVSFVHHWGIVGRFGQHVAATIPSLEYLETEAGIRQIATRSEKSVRVSDWTFPNKNHIVVPGPHDGDPWIDVGHWIVPNDDNTSTRLMIYSIPSVSPEADRRITRYFEEVGDYNPADHHDDLFIRKRVPDDVLIQLTSAQDYVAAVGQSGVVDRSMELLGRSDMGIAFLRRIFWRELEALREGKSTKAWRRLEKDLDMPQQVPEHAEA